MAGRIRSIKPEILDDEEVSSLSDEAWRLWVSSWLLADDLGNCRAGDKYLAALVWQDTSRSPRVAASLRELRRARRVVVYVNGGERYLSIRNWAKHQRIDNAGKPRVPGPDHEDSRPWEDSRGDSPQVAETRRDPPLDQRPPTNDHDHDDPDRAPVGVLALAKVEPSALDFEAVYRDYPRKLGKKRGLAILRRVATTPAKLEAVRVAVGNYARTVAGQESQFIKHFDSFMGCWEDYATGVPAITATRPTASPWAAVRADAERRERQSPPRPPSEPAPVASVLAEVFAAAKGA